MSDNENAGRWVDGPLVCIDTETTGTDAAEARIVTAAIVWMEPTSGATDSETWLANPGVDIPAQATEVHGITTDFARDHGDPAAQVCHELWEQLRVAWEHGSPVIAFNAAYDLTVLDAELRRHHGHGLGEIGPVVDPYVIDRAVDRYRRGKRKLGLVCKAYGIDLTEDAAHTSDGDALATAQLTVALARRHPLIAGMTLPDLHAWQAKAHRAWAESTEAWLRDTKRREGASEAEVEAIVFEREWPLRGAAVDGLPAAVSVQ